MSVAARTRRPRRRRLSRDFAFSLAAEPSRHGPQQRHFCLTPFGARQGAKTVSPG
jgi:hypothetical protein